MTNKTQPGIDQTIDEILGIIANDLLDVETLDTRHSDALDFHEVAVWQLRKALRAAFEAGTRQV